MRYGGCVFACRRWLAVGMLLVLGGVLAPTADASVLVVPRDYPTIQSAVNGALDGDTVVVLPAPGNTYYIENVVLKAGVTLVGYGARLSAYDPSGYGDKTAITCPARTGVIGFKEITGLRGFSISVVGNNVRIYGNKKVSRLTVGSGSSSPPVRSVQIEQNAEIDGLILNNAQVVLVKNNLISGHISPFILSPNPSILIRDSQRVNFINNTVVQDPSIYGDNEMVIEGSSQSIAVRNSIFQTIDPPSGYPRPSDIAVNVTTSYPIIGLWYSALRKGVAGQGLIMKDGNLIGTDCQLVSLPTVFVGGTGDVHLKAGSPCIDAGDPNVEDQDGTRSDMGTFGGEQTYFKPTVICTELYHQGLIPEAWFVADSTYANLQIDPATRAAYLAWAQPFVRLMQRSRWVTAAVRPFAVAWAKHMAYVMGASPDDSALGRFLDTTGVPLHRAIGKHLLLHQPALLP